MSKTPAEVVAQSQQRQNDQRQVAEAAASHLFWSRGEAAAAAASTTSGFHRQSAGGHIRPAGSLSVPEPHVPLHEFDPNVARQCFRADLPLDEPDAKVDQDEPNSLSYFTWDPRKDHGSQRFRATRAGQKHVQVKCWSWPDHPPGRSSLFGSQKVSIDDPILRDQDMLKSLLCRDCTLRREEDADQESFQEELRDARADDEENDDDGEYPEADPTDE